MIGPKWQPTVWRVKRMVRVKRKWRRREVKCR
jgi:hypothetical protein